MKSDGLVERLFVVSLQRAIEDTAPEELEIFRHWFDPTDRRPRFHIAPVIGAVGFLRKGRERYQQVMTLAGRYAAQWAYDDVSGFRRKTMRWLGWIARDRFRRGLLRKALRKIHRDADLNVGREGRTLVVTVPNSLFCRAGSADGAEPMCLYYGSLFEGLLELAEGASFSFSETSCKGQGASRCRFEAAR